MTETQIRSALRLHRHNPETYSHAMLARHYCVTADELRSEMERVLRRRKTTDSRRNQRSAVNRQLRPIDEALRQRARHLVWMERTDTRDLTARILGDPIPGRRALDRRHQSA